MSLCIHALIVRHMWYTRVLNTDKTFACYPRIRSDYDTSNPENTRDNATTNLTVEVKRRLDFGIDFCKVPS